MPDDVQQLLADVAELTGAEMPELLHDEAPVVQDEALAAAESDGFYLVGLIGGKEVGKSAIVNALVGETITESTAYGPGTQIAIAYAHRSRAAQVKKLLEREAPGRFKIVAHDNAELARQVLLDLPDVDSQYSDHLELTRRMLRHMLFPVWVQSVEKYADQQPQKLLAAVAAGNDPANFVFCLNKVDQVEAKSPPGKAGEIIDELRHDYAARIARVLRRTITPADVHMISAARPETFEFPRLREKLAQQKSSNVVKQSVQLAGRQRDRSMLGWIDSQQLPARVERLTRLENEAEELVASRLGVPLMETSIGRILDDPAHRLAMTDEVMTARVARWPMVNLLHTLLAPLTAAWRRNAGAAPTPEALVEVHARPPERPLAGAVQATFALLQQTNPMVSTLYRNRKLWEPASADAAAADLRRSYIATLERQRAAAMQQLARSGPIGALARWMLTIGAILWFPIVQPLLEIFLTDGWTRIIGHTALLVVQLLGAAYLLKSAGFLAIWFAVLWLALRWNTQRRVQRLLRGWRSAGENDPALNLASATVAWMDDLLDPIRQARERAETLAKRADELKSGMRTAAA